MKTANYIQPGTLVKYSHYGLEPERLQMVKYTSGPERAKAEKWYADKAAKRGTIKTIIEGKYCTYYEIDWGNGIISQTQPYLITEA